MIDYKDYLRLLPKTELHCHFTSTMTAALFLKAADRYGVTLPTSDPDRLFDFADLSDFLVAFRKAHDVLRTPADFSEVAYQGVRFAVARGALRYREYYINPQYFWSRGLTYRQVIAPVIEGLRAAEQDFGVGFRIVVAISRQETAGAAIELVEQVIADPVDAVVGIGMDDLTPEGTEDPIRFAAAYELARGAGLRTTAHVGETDHASAENVRIAMDTLHCDRIDHGYKIMDDPDLVQKARDLQVPFAATPVSTTICSGWTLDPGHRIAQMIAAGLNVSVSTDDAMFFKTDLGREYADALHAFGLRPADMQTIARAGIDGAFCDGATKRRLHAQFTAEFLALDHLLGPDA